MGGLFCGVDVPDEAEGEGARWWLWDREVDRGGGLRWVVDCGGSILGFCACEERLRLK